MVELAKCHAVRASLSERVAVASGHPPSQPLETALIVSLQERERSAIARLHTHFQSDRAISERLDMRCCRRRRLMMWHGRGKMLGASLQWPGVSGRVSVAPCTPVGMLRIQIGPRQAARGPIAKAQQIKRIQRYRQT